MAAFTAVGIKLPAAARMVTSAREDQVGSALEGDAEQLSIDSGTKDRATAIQTMVQTALGVGS